MGVAQWGAVHRGRTYLFTSQAQQQKFLSDPDRYSPILSGIDPTQFIDSGAVADGKRNHGMWFRGKMYLFSSEESLQRFQGSPEYYAQRSREVMMRGTMR
jgi:YHS domain-containing protein